MKKLIKKLPFLLLLVLFFGCSKDNSSSSSTPTPTSLKITVNDDTNNPVSQAQVKLYGSQTDYINSTNQLFTTQTTNTAGEVSFSPVIYNQTYYWTVTKDCRTNYFSTHNTQVLISNTVNNYYSTLNETGILKFVNTSANPYNVFVNNVLVVSSMAGGSTKSYYYQSGNYSIRVEQQSGYVLYPTITTYTGTLNCGGTLTTTFP